MYRETERPQPATLKHHIMHLSESESVPVVHVWAGVCDKLCVLVIVCESLCLLLQAMYSASLWFAVLTDRTFQRVAHFWSSMYLQTCVPTTWFSIYLSKLSKLRLHLAQTKPTKPLGVYSPNQFLEALSSPGAPNTFWGQWFSASAKALETRRTKQTKHTTHSARKWTLRLCCLTKLPLPTTSSDVWCVSLLGISATYNLNLQYIMFKCLRLLRNSSRLKHNTQNSL